MNIDLGKAFGFVFEDEQWIGKVLIGGLISIIPIVNFAIFGWMIQIARSVSQGNSASLPNWGDFGRYFMDGLLYIVIAIVYAIPMFLLMCIGVLPVALLGGDEAAAGAAILMVMCLMLLAVALGLVLSVITTAAVIRFIETGSLGAAFQFGEVLSMVRSDTKSWLIIWLYGILFGIVAQIGSSIFIIGLLFTYPYGMAGLGHVFGQVVAQRRAAAGAMQPGASTF
jgi:hypothetical protein